MSVPLNADIRKAIRKADLHNYEVAAGLGIAQSTLYYRLQAPLKPEQREAILETIERLKAQKYRSWRAGRENETKQ